MRKLCTQFLLQYLVSTVSLNFMGLLVDRIFPFSQGRCIGGIQQVLAAPTALGIAEILNQQEKNIYYGNEGFSISTDKTDWLPLPVTENPSIKIQFINPKESSQAKLTVRTENLEQNLSLKAYIHQSMRDYNRFGFEILAQRPLKINQQAAFLIDLKPHSSNMQLRQVIFKKEKKIVLLTCSAHKDDFQQDLIPCNQIYRNFKWL